MLKRDISFNCHRWQMSFKKDVVRNFTIFIKACNFIKKRLQRRCFHVNLAEFQEYLFYGGLRGWNKMKRPATSRWNVAKTSQWCVFTTSYWNVIMTSQKDVTTTPHHYVSTTSQASLKWNTQRCLDGTLPQRLSGASPRRLIGTS